MSPRRCLLEHRVDSTSLELSLIDLAMSRIYQSVTSYLPFGRKADPPAEPENNKEKLEDKPPAEDEKHVENGKHLQNEDAPAADTKEGDVETKEDSPELPSNKKTDEVYDPKAQPGLIRWAAGGIAGTATSAVGLGVGGIKWVASTGYNATSTVVSTTTGVIKKVPQVIKRKDKKE